MACDRHWICGEASSRTFRLAFETLERKISMLRRGVRMFESNVGRTKLDLCFRRLDRTRFINPAKPNNHLLPGESCLGISNGYEPVMADGHYGESESLPAVEPFLDFESDFGQKFSMILT